MWTLLSCGNEPAWGQISRSWHHDAAAQGDSMLKMPHRVTQPCARHQMPISRWVTRPECAEAARQVSPSPFSRATVTYSHDWVEFTCCLQALPPTQASAGCSGRLGHIARAALQRGPLNLACSSSDTESPQGQRGGGAGRQGLNQLPRLRTGRQRVLTGETQMLKACKA